MPYLIFRIHPNQGVPRFLVRNSEITSYFELQQVTIVMLAQNGLKSRAMSRIQVA